MHRYLVYVLAILLFPVCLWLAGIWPAWYWGVGATAAMAILGTWDLVQKRSTLRRNYPVLAHFRYGLESIGPEIRQYFVQSDLEDVPFSRQQRALIYQRSKNEMDVVPFGTLRSTYAVDYEWINHSLAPAEVADHDFRVLIGP
ncbi:MAG: FMN-binding glutamate synthase family protein, partial [Stenotrophomonas sp.]